MQKCEVSERRRFSRKASWILGFAGLASIGPLVFPAQADDSLKAKQASPPASAQAPAKARPAPAAAVRTLQDITVTGQYPAFGADGPTTGYIADTSRGGTKTDTPLIETPQTVNVITRQQIEDQGARSINDALQYTPGVFTGLAGASKRQDVVSLRGFHAGDVNNMFLDGLRLLSDPGSYTNIQINPFFLERIDVIKGPSSVLYGHAMPGGLVNYTTKKPLAKRQGLIEFYGGSFDTVGGGIDFTGPLPDKDWGSYRLIGQASTSDTQFDVVKRESYTIMPEVSLNLTDDTTLLLSAYIQHDPAGGFHGAVPYDLSVDGSRFGGTVDPSWVDQSRGNNKFDRDERLFSYELTHRVNDNITLHSRSRYTNVDTELAQVYQIGFTAAPDDGAMLNRYYSGANEHFNAFSTDNYAAIDFTTGPVKHELLTGLGFQWRDNHVRLYSAPATELDPFHPDYDNSGLPPGVTPSLAADDDRKLKQLGVYMQDQMSWNRWHVVLSGREDYLERGYKSRLNGDRAKRSDNAFSGRAAILYRSKWGIAPYFSYSEAFSPNAYAPADGDIPAPVKSHQYEIGVKYQPESIDALFTLALYDLTQENVQQRTSVTPIRYIGAGDINAKGMELTARANVTEKLHVIAGYSYNDIKYQDDIDTGGVRIKAGNTPVLSPRQMASLWVAYDFPRGISAGLGGRYVGESYANSANTLKVPDYALMDAFVSADLGEYWYQLDGLSLRVNANNLLGKDHVTGCFNETYCYYGEKRSVIATVDYRF